MKAVAATAVLAGLVVLVVGLTTDTFRQAAPIPPAGDESSTLTDEPTLVFTGDECTYSGPRVFSITEDPDSGHVRFEFRNESSIEAFMLIFKVPAGVAVEDLVAGFPVIEDATLIPPPPSEVIAWRQMPPGAEGPMAASLRNHPGRVGTACVPFNGDPWLVGAVLTVEDLTEALSE